VAGASGTDTVLPWGWWLRVNGAVIEDARGRCWNSVRQAYWEGELGFPATHLVSEQLELLLRVLAAVDRRWAGSDELKHDLFGGDMLFWRFYQCWMWSVGLLATDPRVDPLSASLSEQGRSVLVMLQATREPEWISLPFAAVLDTLRESNRTAADDQRERSLRAFERGVVRMSHLFARESINGLHVVTLTGLDTFARMPMRKVVWSQSFPEVRVRDDFFAWLAERVDRWEDWGGLAYSKGAGALTRHLLGLFVAAHASG